MTPDDDPDNVMLFQAAGLILRRDLDHWKTEYRQRNNLPADTPLETVGPILDTRTGLAGLFIYHPGAWLQLPGGTLDIGIIRPESRWALRTRLHRITYRLHRITYRLHRITYRIRRIPTWLRYRPLDILHRR